MDWCECNWLLFGVAELRRWQWAIVGGELWKIMSFPTTTNPFWPQVPNLNFHFLTPTGCFLTEECFFTTSTIHNSDHSLIVYTCILREKNDWSVRWVIIRYPSQSCIAKGWVPFRKNKGAHEFWRCKEHAACFLCQTFPVSQLLRSGTH